MKFKVQVVDLNQALEVASIVTPKSLKGKAGDAGKFYLFSVLGGECFVYSAGDTELYSRARLSVEEVEGEGVFLYPANQINAMQFVDGWIQIESGKDDGTDRYWVRFECEDGSNGEQTTISPESTQSFAKDFEDAKKLPFHEYPAALLREGFSLVRGYLPDTDKKHLNTAQLFDKSREKWADGNGSLIGADGTATCCFYSKQLEDKGLGVHSSNLSYVLTFLSKCTGNVRVYTGVRAVFAETEDGSRVLGWVHRCENYDIFRYYPADWDKFILCCERDILIKALKFVKASLEGEKNDKVRVAYDHQAKTIVFRVSQSSSPKPVSSRPISVTPIELAEEKAGGLGTSTDFAVNTSIEYLLNLLVPMKSPKIFLRVAPIPAREGRKEGAYFRVVEEYMIDSKGKVVIAREGQDEPFQCKVTRFMISKV
jgi:hypothetical protein